MLSRLSAIVLAASLASSSCVLAADATRSWFPFINDADLVVEPLARLAKISGQIIEGHDVEDPGAFPASYYARVSAGSIVSRCTATLIGPRVIATAAHCVGDGKTITVVNGASSFSGLCFRHHSFNTNKSADLALCVLKQMPGDVVAERVAATNYVVKKNDLVTLAGFGCTTRFSAGGNDGVFRVGTSSVSHTTGGDAEGTLYFVTESNPAAPAVVCPGDSGGAVFCESDPNNLWGSRQVCGIISRFECHKWQNDQICEDIGHRSYLTDFYKAYLTFADWSKPENLPTQLKGHSICGLSPGIDHLCRQN